MLRRAKGRPPGSFNQMTPTPKRLRFRNRCTYFATSPTYPNKPAADAHTFGSAHPVVVDRSAIPQQHLREAVASTRGGQMTESPPEPQEPGPEGPAPGDDPETEPDGGPQVDAPAPPA